MQNAARQPIESTAAALETHAFVADRGDHAIRLDLVVQRHLRGRVSLSRRRLQAAIEMGQVSVNGSSATKPAGRVAAGDRIEVRLPARAARETPQPQPLPLDVLFEDEHLLAVNKRSGIVVHPSYKHRDTTLFNALLWHVQSVAGAGSAVHPRLLQRLDKDTSGIVLVSKTKAAHDSLVRSMRAGRLTGADERVAEAIRLAGTPGPSPGLSKEYLAIVHGVPRARSGLIETRLQRDPRDMRRVVVSESGGKESVTRYEVLASGGGVSLLRCDLLTGRTHQIRVHLAERGWPIVGDRVYGAVSGGSARRATEAEAFPRQALHAWRVRLPHPISAEALVIVAPIPEDMGELLDRAGIDGLQAAGLRA